MLVAVPSSRPCAPTVSHANENGAVVMVSTAISITSFLTNDTPLFCQFQMAAARNIERSTDSRNPERGLEDNSTRQRCIYQKKLVKSRDSVTQEFENDLLEDLLRISDIKHRFSLV